MPRRQPRLFSSIVVRGRRYGIERWLTVGNRRFGVIERLTEGRERYLVFDPAGAPRGCLRALHFHEDSPGAFGRLKVLERLNDSRLPVMVECLRAPPRLAALFLWVEGTTLESLLSEMRAGRRERPASDVALQMVRNLAHAVQKVNDVLNVVHGDVKPANVIVRRRNITNLCLIDFGSGWCVEHSVRESGGGDGITWQVYASPEQRQPGVVPDFRSDMFSVGVIAYELLTGTSPYAGMGGGAGASAALAEDFAGSLEPPSAFRQSDDCLSSTAWQALDRAVMGSLELDRDKRFANWREFCGEVDLAYAAMVAAPQLGRGWERLFRWMARAAASLGWKHRHD